MGYYSTNDRRDGRFRKIEVRLPDKPGLTRARAQGLRGAARQGAGDQGRGQGRPVAGAARRDGEPVAAAGAAAGA